MLVIWLYTIPPSLVESDYTPRSKQKATCLYLRFITIDYSDKIKKAGHVERIGKRKDAYRGWWENLSERDPFVFLSVSSSSISTKTRVAFRPAQPSLSILSRMVLQSAVASGTSNPQFGGEPGI
jgi:hypothetical protein